MSADHPPLCPIARPYALWMMHKGLVGLESIRWFQRLALSRQTVKKKMRQATHTLDLADFIDNLSDYVHVRILDPDPQATFLYRGCPLVSLTWIPSWGPSALDYAKNVQLDCSFEVTRPFVYCVPQGIRDNEALPLGFIVSLSENTQIYQWFFDDILDSSDDLHALPPRPILSDQHLSLKSFCDQNHLRQFQCHRHLIQCAGANSPIGILVTYALRQKSERSFKAHRPQYLAWAVALVQAGILTRRECEKFYAFMADPFEHAIWHRTQSGASSCTNHAERFHGVVNEALTPRQTLPERLAVLRDHIITRWQLYGRGRPRQVSEVMAQLRRLNAPSDSDCLDPDCEDYRQIMGARYGIPEFPCKHQLNEWNHERVTVLPRPPLRYQVTDGRRIEVVTLEKRLPAAFREEGPASEDRKAPTSRLPTWGDEEVFGPEATAVRQDGNGQGESGLQQWGAEQVDKKIAHDITEGVVILRKHAPAMENVEAWDVLPSVWEDLRRRTMLIGDLGGRIQISAQVTADWWRWAKCGGARPVPAHGWSFPTPP
jgi:hypothetical protein